MKKKEFNRLRNQLIRWYRKDHRVLPWRETNDPYHIWVSEVMLQQTQVNTVLSYYRRFLVRFPDVESLARADLQAVLKAWEGLGYYGRARNLHEAARSIVDDLEGKIPDTLEAFLTLPGVGEYIGAAVQSIAFHRPHAVLDGNVKRLLARLFLIIAPVNRSGSLAAFRGAAADLLDKRNPGTFNQAVMELGALVCKPKNPNCEACPLPSFCQAYQHQQTNDYPKKVKRKPIPEHHVAVGVVLKDNKVLITRRKPEGLLGGLWEFPGGEVKNDETAGQACTREIKEEVALRVGVVSYLTRIKHAYTHFKIVMDVFICSFLSGKIRLTGPVDYRWITLNEIDHYPFPKANHKFIPFLKAFVKELSQQ